MGTRPVRGIGMIARDLRTGVLEYSRSSIREVKKDGA